MKLVPEIPDLKTLVVKNRLKDIIEKQTGAARYVPSEIMLQSIGMTGARFKLIYTGKRNPSFEELYFLSQAFKFSPEDIYIVSDPAKNTGAAVIELEQNLLKKYGS